MNVKGKTIVVTGGGRGLGRAMSLAFASKGARLAIVGIDESVIEEAVVLCEEAGGEAKAYKANVSEEAAIIDLFDRVAKDFGALHGLINNAGITRDALLVKATDGKVVKKMSFADWQAVINVDLTGVFLRARGGGKNDRDGHARCHSEYQQSRSRREFRSNQLQRSQGGCGGDDGYLGKGIGASWDSRRQHAKWWERSRFDLS